MKWKWRRKASGLWQARHGTLVLTVETAEMPNKTRIRYVDAWQGSVYMGNKWADNSLFRHTAKRRKRRAAQRVAERAVPLLLRDAGAAIRRKVTALGVEIPDDD